MGIELKKEAALLEAELGGSRRSKAGKLGYQKFKARAYRVTTAAGESVGTVEDRIGHRVIVERVVRRGSEIDCGRSTVLEAGDEIVLAGPTAALVGPAPRSASRSKAPRSCSKCSAMRARSSSAIGRCTAEASSKSPSRSGMPLAACSCGI
jgi:hypothetical protein